ncbi:NADH:ubiquinone oxidoreductase [Pseudomonas duriflava]|nr:NADH:ubiquinone oxidoreductase [Pseudomonas duriflava]
MIIYRWFILLFSLLPVFVQAEACIVHSEGKHVDVKVCQQNRTIPAQLFHEGFCKPELADQNVNVTYAEQCPAGGFGVCQKAHVQGTPYQQDIYYYGVPSDARFLKPFCEQQNKGHWLDRLLPAQKSDR